MHAGRKVGIVVGVLLALLAGYGVWWLFFVAQEPDPFEGAAEVAEAYAVGWQGGDLAAVDYAPPQVGAEVADRVATITAGLTAAEADRPSSVEVLGVDEDLEDDTRGTARYAVRWTLDDGAEWAYEVAAPLQRGEEGWGLAWSPAVVHPSLVHGRELGIQAVEPERGNVLDAAGQPLFGPRQVVTVGIATPPAGQPTPTLAELQATAATVASTLGLDAAALQRRVAEAPPDYFVDAVTLRRERYDQVRDVIRPLPGTRFLDDTRLLSPATGFAANVLGSVGPATAEDIEQGGGAVVEGQIVGQGGLQEAYEDRLAGTPGLQVVSRPEAPPEGGEPDGSEPEPVEVLFDVPAIAGADLRTTLDTRVQLAADAALAAAPRPSALVAVRPSTGAVLAVANGGAGADGFNRALEGRYPPGSTFKVVTTTALLGAGLGPDDVVDCPPTINVGGRQFVNAESGALGPVPFRVDVAQSCNTAFVGLADRIDDAQLQAAGAALGLREAYALGVPSFGGEVPVSGDVVEHAAAMIGQGRVLASPVGMAVVAASVAQGATVTPTLLVDPVPPPPEGAAAAPSPLDAGVAGTVRQLMRGVVEGGTSTVLAPVPGAPVHAKSGTAEFGTGTPPPTHAWMVGFQGDLAFAVLVEDGGFGAQTAGPIAAAFLTALA